MLRRLAVEIVGALALGVLVVGGAASTGGGEVGSATTPDPTECSQDPACNPNWIWTDPGRDG